MTATMLKLDKKSQIQLKFHSKKKHPFFKFWLGWLFKFWFTLSESAGIWPSILKISGNF